MKKIETEIWSRVTGFFRPLKNFNGGKKEEFKERKFLKLNAEKINGYRYDIDNSEITSGF